MEVDIRVTMGEKTCGPCVCVRTDHEKEMEGCTKFQVWLDNKGAGPIRDAACLSKYGTGDKPADKEVKKMVCGSFDGNTTSFCTKESGHDLPHVGRDPEGRKCTWWHEPKAKPEEFVEPGKTKQVGPLEVREHYEKILQEQRENSVWPKGIFKPDPRDAVVDAARVALRFLNEGDSVEEFEWARGNLTKALAALDAEGGRG